VEARELEGREVRALVAVREGVFAATDQGVFKSDDGGLTWRSTNLRVSTFALAYTESGALLAGTESGIYRSNDRGETWALIGLEGKLVRALASTGAVIYAGTSEGVYVTADGAVWKHAGLRENVVSLATRPGDPRVVYAGTAGAVIGRGLGDLYYSTDGGVSWVRCWFSNATALALLFAGLPVHYEVSSILVNPCEPHEVYASTNAVFTVLMVIPVGVSEVKVSRDAGSTWISARLPSGISALSLGPGCKWLLAGTSDGVYLSTDRGATWFKLDPANASVQATAVDPGGKIYAGKKDGLTIFVHKPLATSLSLRVLGGSEVSLNVSGSLVSGDVKLPERKVSILVNGREVKVCFTNSTGGYECVVPLIAGEESALNLTAYFLGDFCYKPSSISLTLYLVSVSTEHGSVSGAGWYEAGSTATVTISPVTVTKDVFFNYVFKGWSVNGSLVSTSPSYTFVVNKPLTLTAVWRVEANIFAVCIAAVGILLVTVALAAIVFAIVKGRGP